MDGKPALLLQAVVCQVGNFGLEQRDNPLVTFSRGEVMTLDWRHDRTGLGGSADADIEFVGIDLIGLNVHHAHARDLNVENVVVDQKLALVLDCRLRVIGSHP